MMTVCSGRWLQIKIHYILFMNFSDQDSINVITDSQIAEKAADFLNLIQCKIASKSFEGARQILSSPYASTLLEKESISFMKAQVDKAEENFKLQGNRFFWQWWIIYAISTLITAYMALKYGIIDKAIAAFKTTSLTAKVFIGSAVFSIAAMIGGAFSCICRIVKNLIHRIFG